MGRHAYVIGTYEHLPRKASDKSVVRLDAELAKGMFDQAGLTMDDVDGCFCNRLSFHVKFRSGRAAEMGFDTARFLWQTSELR